MAKYVTLKLDNKDLELELITGTEKEQGIDISRLRAETGLITVDTGYVNTGSCISEITFIDGEKGILRHRGYPIEELITTSNFLEISYLVIYGELPKKDELENFSSLIIEHTNIHTSLQYLFNNFPAKAPPMAILPAMLNALACYNTELLNIAPESEEFDIAAAKIISKVCTIAAWAYRKSLGLTFNHPNPNLNYCANFLHMMFSMPYKVYHVQKEIEEALNLFFILHADHEQNCSTSTVRVIGSSRANLFSSISGGVCALWGPLHGGANMAVIKMLEDIHERGEGPMHYINLAKDKNSEYKLMGFGHRVYKNFDPRAKILKVHVDKVLKVLNIKDPLLDIAKEIEETVLKDDYFIEKKLYPNVDFYSGIFLRAIGIPVNMFTVLFVIERIPCSIEYLSV